MSFAESPNELYNGRNPYETNEAMKTFLAMSEDEQQKLRNDEFKEWKVIYPGLNAIMRTLLSCYPSGSSPLFVEDLLHLPGWLDHWDCFAFVDGSYKRFFKWAESHFQENKDRDSLLKLADLEAGLQRVVKLWQKTGGAFLLEFRSLVRYSTGNYVPTLKRGGDTPKEFMEFRARLSSVIMDSISLCQMLDHEKSVRLTVHYPIDSFGLRKPPPDDGCRSYPVCSLQRHLRNVSKIQGPEQSLSQISQAVDALNFLYFALWPVFEKERDRSNNLFFIGDFDVLKYLEDGIKDLSFQRARLIMTCPEYIALENSQYC